MAAPGVGAGVAGTMPDAPPEYIQLESAEHGRRMIAVRRQPGRRPPGLLWLSGFNSRMTSEKATALAAWAARTGHSCTRFDYSGHGESSGRLEDGTAGAWIEEALAVLRSETEGPQILVGSSLGGWLALCVLRALCAAGPAEAGRVAGLLLIAPAWNMTRDLVQARLPAEARRSLAESGVWHRPSAYGDGTYPITRRLIEEGERHLLLAPFRPSCPVRIIHGEEDADVPLAHSRRLLELLAGGDVTLRSVPGGGHRLSRPQDLAAILELAEGLAGSGRAR